jgi:hypothetical protein
VYYHQYVMTLSYSIVGGGTPTAPAFTASRFGASTGVTLTASATGYWFDGGSTWNVADPLGGSTATERWFTSQPVGGTVSSAQTVAFAYSHQFRVTFQQIGLDISANGTVLTVGNATKTRGDLPYSDWFNSGTIYKFSDVVQSVTPNKRFVLGRVSGLASPITSSGTVTAIYTVQIG